MKDPLIKEVTARDKGTLPGDAVAMAAAVIRERSADALLVSAAEITRYVQKRLASSDTNITCEDIPAMLTRMVDENEDLHSLAGAGSQWYYSARSMTDAYANILLQKLEGPVRLIAETVRHNSSAYQRPVPLELFTAPPFDLTHQQVLDGLETMAATDGYEDIASTITSASGIYLYSTKRLEADHAEMLAEWFHVGQAENP